MKHLKSEGPKATPGLLAPLHNTYERNIKRTYAKVKIGLHSLEARAAFNRFIRVRKSNEQEK